MQTLSLIIITKNEANNIRTCLESVPFASEIIVYDSGSTDDTVAIAREYTDKIVVTDWPGDGAQKNRAINIATGDWILCLDADEHLSTELQQEMKALLSSEPQHQSYDIPFQSSFMGKLIRFGDWSNESHIRLFKNGSGKFTEEAVHCRLLLEGSTGHLKNKVFHKTIQSLEQMLYKMNDYSSRSANIKLDQGKRSSLLGAIVRAFWAFIRGYIIRLGFLDGREGLMLAIANAEGTYYRYLKLCYLP